MFFRRRAASDNSDVPCRSTHNAEIADQLLLAEYSTLRAESLQAFVTSQSIIQWSLAAYGVLFGAGLVALTSGPGVGDRETISLAAFMIFFVILPGFTLAAALHWLGEITRMERAGAYLRGLEYRVRNDASFQHRTAPREALGWETFLSGPHRSNKRTLPYVGVAGLFFGAFAGSLCFGLVWYFGRYAHHPWALPHSLWIVVAVLFLVAFLWSTLSSGRQVLRLGRSRYDIGTDSLVQLRPK